MEPFLKWPGGKRWIASQLATEIRSALRGVYFEPFLGGGAVFFALGPKRAVLSDVNEDLVNVYRAVQVVPVRKIVRRLKLLKVSRGSYYAIRADVPKSEIDRAVRFIYLNRTGFGGIYRLNRAGRFNVPYGGGERTPAILWERKLLEKAASALADVDVRCADFGAVMGQAQKGDVVYCDPTYTVAHDSNGFVRYNESNFSWADQERLAECARRAAERGVTVFVSNACNDRVRRLYPQAKVRVLRRISRVSPVVASRREIKELLLVVPAK